MKLGKVIALAVGGAAVTALAVGGVVFLTRRPAAAPVAQPNNAAADPLGSFLKGITAAVPGAISFVQQLANQNSFGG